MANRALSFHAIAKANHCLASHIKTMERYESRNQFYVKHGTYRTAILLAKIPRVD